MPAPNWKEPRRALDRQQLRRDKRSIDEKARREIRIRDGHTCRLCGRKTNVVHEHVRRGAGGLVSPINSFLLCSIPDGGLCHDLVQTRWVYPVMAAGDVPFDARGELVFEMSKSTAKRIFGDAKNIPAHVRIAEG